MFATNDEVHVLVLHRYQYDLMPLTTLYIIMLRKLYHMFVANNEVHAHVKL